MSRENSFHLGGRPPCPLPSEDSSHSFWHSQPSALLNGHRSTRNLPQTADIVIIGSGITGTSVAHNLLTNNDQNDSSVVMLEAREACWGATGRNGGHCEPILFEHPHDPSIGDFELANFHALRNLIESKNIDCEFHIQPAVVAIYSRSSLNAIELALLVVKQNAPEQANLMRIVTDQKELENLRIPTALGAIVTNIAARLWPYKFVSRILEDLLTSTKLNGTFNLQTLTPVECLAPYDMGRWTVKTNRGCIVARKVVLATNAYTSHLLPKFADLIVPVRGQMSALLPPPSVADKNRLQTSFGFFREGEDDYLIQRPNERGGHLMFGGGRQLGESVGVADDSVIDRKVAEFLRGKLVKNLNLEEEVEGNKMIPCLRCTNLKHPYSTRENSCRNCKVRQKPTELTATYEWTGIMGFSRDSHPWVGEIPSKPNLYIAAGFTGHGMPNTWLSGKYLALLLSKSLHGSSDRHGEGRSYPGERDGVSRMVKELARADIRKYEEESAKAVGLPRSYMVSEERIERAMELEDVGTRDSAEMARSKRGRQGDRMPSGYA